MSETWMGVIIGGPALSVAMLMVVDHYRRERMRARLLRHLEHHEWWRQTRGRM